MPGIPPTLKIWVASLLILFFKMHFNPAMQKHLLGLQPWRFISYATAHFAQLAILGFVVYLLLR